MPELDALRYTTLRGDACLVRKSGLRAAEVVDRTKYLHSMHDAAPDQVLADNVRALELWLRRPFTRVDLALDLLLPAGVAEAIMPVLVDGRRELSAMLDAERGIDPAPFQVERVEENEYEQV